MGRWEFVSKFGLSLSKIVEWGELGRRWAEVGVG